MPEKIDGFLDNLAEFGNGTFFLLIREYSQLAVNVSSSSPEISDLIKNNLFQLNLAQKNEKVV